MIMKVRTDFINSRVGEVSEHYLTALSYLYALDDEVVKGINARCEDPEATRKRAEIQPLIEALRDKIGAFMAENSYFSIAESLNDKEAEV